MRNTGMEQPEIENPTLGAWRGGTCEKHGMFVSKHLWPKEPYAHWSRCQKCEEERRRKDQETEKQRMHEEHIASLVRAARIPDRFFLKTLADYEATTAGERDALSVAK